MSPADAEAEAVRLGLGPLARLQVLKATLYCPLQVEIMMRRRDFLVFGLGATGATIVKRTPAAETYPSRPVHLFVPSVPGGVHDVIGRLWVERVKSILGTVVIDNRGGGGGVIAATAVAQAPPDGYSLLLGSTSTHALV